MSGIKPPEYQKLQEMFDIVTRHLGDILSAEELAAKLYVKKLITRGMQEKAGLRTITNTDRIRDLMIAICAKVEIDREKYHKFLAVLKAISWAEDIGKLLEL